MITAVDTSVLLDVFAADPLFGRHSQVSLRRALSEGGLVACPVVWAEVSAGFPSSADAVRAMEDVGVAFSPIDLPVAVAAGGAWHAYRRAGGRRQRLLADFLIGAHADARSDRLLTRDRGFYRRYFAGLQILAPALPT